METKTHDLLMYQVWCIDLVGRIQWYTKGLSQEASNETMMKNTENANKEIWDKMWGKVLEETMIKKDKEYGRKCDKEYGRNCDNEYGRNCDKEYRIKCDKEYRGNCDKE